MRRNHWLSRRFSTAAPERQPRPSTTCSLASTVWSTGSQLTKPRGARPGRPPACRGTASAAGRNSPAGRWRTRGPSSATGPAASASARIASMLARSRRPGCCRARGRRSRPAGRTRPSPSGAARRGRGRACSGRPRRPACSCGRGPCAAGRWDRGTSPARSISAGRAAARPAPRSRRPRPRPPASAARLPGSRSAPPRPGPHAGGRVGHRRSGLSRRRHRRAAGGRGSGSSR